MAAEFGTCARCGRRVSRLIFAGIVHDWVHDYPTDHQPEVES